MQCLKGLTVVLVAAGEKRGQSVRRARRRCGRETRGKDRKISATLRSPRSARVWALPALEGPSGGGRGGGGRGRRRRRRDRGEGVSRRADQEHNVSHMGPIDMSSRHAIHARPAPWSWPTRRPALAHTQPKVLVGVGAELFARLDSKNLGTGGAKQRIFGAGGETWLDSCCHTPSVPARTYLGRRLVSFKEQLLLTVVGLWYPLCFRCFC